MPSAICFNLDQSKVLSSGNGLNHIEYRVFNGFHFVKVTKTDIENNNSTLSQTSPGFYVSALQVF